MAIVGSSLDGRSLGLGAQGPPSCVDDAAMVKQESIGDLIKIPTTTIGTSLLAATLAVIFVFELIAVECKTNKMPPVFSKGMIWIPLGCGFEN